MSTAELLEQARRLTREEQMKLAHDLWVEADGPYDDPADVEAAWATDIGHACRLSRMDRTLACPTPKSVSASVCDPGTPPNVRCGMDCSGCTGSLVATG